MACAWIGVRSGSKISAFGVQLHRADQHLFQLAAADQVLGVRLGAVLLDDTHHAHARRVAKLAQLGDAAAGVGAVAAGHALRPLPLQVDHDQQGPGARIRRDRRRRNPLELVFQRVDERSGVQRAPVKRLRRQDPPGFGGLPVGGRQQVGDVQVRRTPVGQKPDRRHEIQPQQRQVDQVVPGQRLVAQVGVHQTKPAEAPAPRAQTADLRQVDARGIPHEDVLDLAAPVDQDADLPLDLARDRAEIRRQLGRSHLRRFHAPAVNALQRMLLARLEPDDIARDRVQDAEVSTRPGRG